MLSDAGDKNGSAACLVSVFAQIDSLPDPELWNPIFDWKGHR